MNPTRRIALLGSLAAVAAAPGCQWMKEMRFPSIGAKGPPLEPKPASEFVGYLNRQAELIQGLSYTDVSMSVGTGGVIEPNLNASLDCQKPRSFRMKGSHSLQSGQMDVGSNDRQLWMYVRHVPQGQPNFIFASHDDLASNRVSLPVPFDPDWIFMALGMSPVDPVADAKVDINARNRTYDLTYLSRTPQNDTVRKVTIFGGDKPLAGDPQVKRHLILNAKTDAPIATAEIRGARRFDLPDPRGGTATVEIPIDVKLVFHAPDNQKLSLDMTLRGEKVNPQFSAEQSNWLFGMPNEVNGSRPVNLASMARPQSRGQAPNRRK
jgi:hypothetical protein